MGVSVDGDLKCLRNKSCMPIEQISSDEEPFTFLCAGINNDESRSVEQDVYCHCFKSATTDTEFYLSETDIKDTICVLSRCLCIGNYFIGDEEE